MSDGTDRRTSSSARVGHGSLHGSTGCYRDGFDHSSDRRLTGGAHWRPDSAWRRHSLWQSKRAYWVIAIRRGDSLAAYYGFRHQNIWRKRPKPWKANFAIAEEYERYAAG